MTKRKQDDLRARAIAALGFAPEPVYDARERNVSPEERRRRAGEMYAGTTGELVAWAREAGHELES